MDVRELRVPMSARNTLHHSSIPEVLQVLRAFGAYSLRSRNKGANIMDGGGHRRENDNESSEST